MIEPHLTRQQLEIINRKTLRYPLQVAEKDYFLSLVMQIISSSSLRDILVFKGGTALNHCYLRQSRFSQDLDFTSIRKHLSLDEVANLFGQSEFLSIKKAYQSKATIKIEKLQYQGMLAEPNAIKVEIDYLQNVVLPPMSLYYANVWGLEFTTNVMDIREICAEKIRAISDRARYRDFYDLFLIMENYFLDLDEIVQLVKRKEIRKPITEKNILQNWSVANSDKTKEMRQVFYADDIDEKKILELIAGLPLGNNAIE